MSQRHTGHEVTIEAPADVVYDIVADVGRWPYAFPPTLHAERVELVGRDERIRIWALANGEVKSWHSRRVLDPDRRRVSFRQEVPAAPVAAMSGEWILRPLDGDRTHVTLTHDYRAVDDDPAGLDWIDRAVDRNSTSELAALARAATAPAGQALDFTDSVEVKGSVADVYEFLYRADAWPERLPHVARVALTEETPGVQTLEMDTGSPDGSTHTTRSVRICWPAGRIVYKQTELPALLGVHTGEWRLTGGPEVVVASSRHVVRIDPTAVPAVLGPDATVDEAAAKVRAALSTNSLTTLRAAKAYAEERRDG
ncbi:aromatase/cyclase [Virgisporangium aurantiacum]|uniref:Actinorhodin polyketide synthase bifunctional cyclase/dehydratase n=1 Tax=Virgisporangium aurantiacum TaxID=175570 RepID=A0A8J4E3X9_9ACTN|nr:aromatase/cyclase [Virgisporangium aurantiacum]GIJ60418.1 actinorhodin polyketide synthase bifunctional cyclase/dehydratase [Virgisporangium aurantiacum]